MGPNTNRPSATGNASLRLPMISTAWATGSGGNSRDSSPPVCSWLRSTSGAIVRFAPTSPPTPLRVKPNPSWIGGNSAVMISRSENPLRPEGNRVLMSPIAFSDSQPATSSWRMPA